MTARDTRRTAFINSLRDLIGFLEAHPKVDAPKYTILNVFVDTRDEVAEQARAATWEKVYNDNWFALRREFGPPHEEGQVTLEINALRETVCRKVVKGTKIVPARAEQVVDVVEWVCEDAVLVGGE